MDLVDGMRVFVSAVETGSFAGAAARVGISPKLASKYMAELEARMGTQLLYRTTRLGLTPAGERLMAQASAWLGQLDEMTADMRDAQRGLSGTIRVSAAVTHGELVIAPLLRQFQRDHPDLVIDLRLSDRFVDLAAGGIDLALRIGQLDDSSLIARRIGTLSLLLVASPSYLAGHGHPATLDDLSDHRCIRDTNMRGDGSWALSDGKSERRTRVTGSFLINSARIARDLAVQDEGIALCPDYVVQDDLGNGRLARVLPSFRGPQLDIHAVYLPQRRLPRRAGSWQGRDDVNSRSIGVEIANPGDRPFPCRQMDAVAALLRGIMSRWGIGPDGVIGHSDMAPGRKIDPGPRFDWQRLACEGLALPGGLGADAPLEASLTRIGYPPVDPAIRLAAFRLRFRPWAQGPEAEADRRTAAFVAASLRPRHSAATGSR